jgi:hypothetical protein
MSLNADLRNRKGLEESPQLEAGTIRGQKGGSSE